jgi:hypothetical protein
MYTTVEESKALLELGLNPMTADMFYTSLDGFRKPWVWVSKPGMHPSDVPCWSTGALMKICEKCDSVELYYGKKGYTIKAVLDRTTYHGYAGYKTSKEAYIDVIKNLKING